MLRAAFEIHCHGGVAAAERILAALTAAGCPDRIVAVRGLERLRGVDD